MSALLDANPPIVREDQTRLEGPLKNGLRLRNVYIIRISSIHRRKIRGIY